jgi:hypothetical protein
MASSSDGTISIFHPDRRLERIALLKVVQADRIALFKVGKEAG